ncbi:MAG: adenylate/guanylate cyclase domain-containing protein [Chloroflexota bacterium]
MTVCAACATPNEAGRKFCGGCGARLARECPACGAPNVGDVRFCGECGSPLSRSAEGLPDAERPSASGLVPGGPSASEPVSERRLVSVLFADLVGFTSYSEGRDPEDVRELLTRHFDMSREVIARYGGTVEKFIGDAVMAVWGVPVAHEDDAERAVRAGLELVDAVTSLAPELRARAAVLTGEAAVTLGATGQGMVAGDLVNTASRLQGVAPVGGVLVGEATMRATSGAIAFELAGEQLLKGKRAPVAAWRAVRVVAEVGGRNRADVLEAPFVGREPEIRLLRELLAATGRERRVRLVSVTGQAGIGKSRLGWEFSKWVDGIVEPVWWHVGRSPSYGEGVTFWALAEMVRGRCGIAEGADATTIRDQVARTIGRWVPEPAEARRIEPALLTLLGVEGPAIAREELFAAWRRFFERIALEGTVVLVFEDLQWADPGLLDFIDHLLRWSVGAPIMILTMARPELLERRPDWGAGQRTFVAMHLEALPDPAMRELLAGLAPGLPEEAVSRIVTRADGVPLYAVEIVRMLVGDGRLVATDGAYHAAGELVELAVPPTLQGLIAARLDALDPIDRRLVQDAAVLGQTFSVSALAAVAGATEAALTAHLATLVQRELLVEEVDPRSPERGQYGFVQALIREVAYSTIGLADRRARHLAAARYFESLGDDSIAGALAAHYLAAHASASADAERDALAAQARIALRGAAERAATLGVHDQALVFLRQALTVTTADADRAALLLAAGDEAAKAGLTTDARRLLEDARANYEAMGDDAGVMAARGALSSACVLERDYEAALEVVGDIEARLSVASDDPGSCGPRPNSHVR